MAATLIQFAGADDHVRVPNDEGDNNIDNPFSLADDVCDDLCAQIYDIQVIQAVELDDGGISATLTISFQLDCRDAGDRDLCPAADDRGASGGGGANVDDLPPETADLARTACASAVRSCQAIFEGETETAMMSPAPTPAPDPADPMDPMDPGDPSGCEPAPEPAEEPSGPDFSDPAFADMCADEVACMFAAFEGSGCSTAFEELLMCLADVTDATCSDCLDLSMQMDVQGCDLMSEGAGCFGDGGGDGTMDTAPPAQMPPPAEPPMTTEPPPDPDPLLPPEMDTCAMLCAIEGVLGCPHFDASFCAGGCDMELSDGSCDAEQADLYLCLASTPSSEFVCVGGMAQLRDPAVCDGPAMNTSACVGAAPMP